MTLKNPSKFRIITICILLVILIIGGITLYTGNNNRTTHSESSTSPLILEIKMEKTRYVIGETIDITAILTNVGNVSLNVSEMGLGLGPPSLDFEIETPEGYTIHYIGPYVETMPKGIKLDPDKNYNYTCNITRPFWNFGNDNGIHNYNFTTPGNYTIRGIYRSDPSRCFDNTVWDGMLYSNTLTFTITILTTKGGDRCG